MEFIPADETKGPVVRLKHTGKAKPNKTEKRGT